MSIHPSLRGVDTLTGDRSVLSRVERLQKLIHDGKMTDQDSPYGLPKVRTKFKLKTAKKEDAEADAAASEAGTGAGTEAGTGAGAGAGAGKGEAPSAKS